MDSVLVIDDDQAIRLLLTRLLAREPIEVQTAEGGGAGLRMADEIGPDVVLVDLRLPDLDGLSVLEALKARHADAAVIMMTAFGQIENAVEAMRRGATDFLEKPFTHPDKLRFSIRRALEGVKARRELSRLHEVQAGRNTADQLIGESEATRRLRELVRQVARSEASTILIQGESGTGKELVAKALHYESARREFPFLGVNCGAITETLFESELFGHEKGAFTDARTMRKGLMELADRGTLFLDEVGEMALGSQVKLLRCLQERVVRRVGGTRDIKVDVKVVAATNRPLEALARDGRFREDLFYRLNVIPITVQPLRERREDILPLARHFLAESGRPLDKTNREFSPETEGLMLGYSWPGNVRELRNFVERLVILGTSGLADPSRMPTPLGTAPEPPARSGTAGTLKPLAEIELAYVREVLGAVNGNRSAAARILGITRQTLRKKLGDIEANTK
jgi:DNA-binding NtrC family response regulator